MKKSLNIIGRLLSLVMIVVMAFGLTACEDIKTMELTLNLYDTSTSEFFSEEDTTFSIDLYRHLAPNTVDAIVNHVNNGFYNGTFFYLEEDTTSQIIFIGDLKYDENGNIVQNLIDGKLPSQIYGEFENNGVKGSNLTCTEGVIGLNRSTYENDNELVSTSSTARDSGRATFMIPQSTFSGYTKNYCFFATYDLEEGNASTCFENVLTVLTTSNYYDNYYVYYTGTYNAENADLNHGLEFHCISEEDYSQLSTEEKDAIFKAEGDQLVCYNAKKITVAKTFSNVSGSAIKSAKIK